jgi:hypothetical protein
MADQTITITLKATGTLEVSADPFMIKPNVNNLSFKCDVGEFAVLFDNNRSPFSSGKKSHGAHKGKSTKKLKIRSLTPSEQNYPVNDRANGASFKYGVAVMNPGTGQVLTLDPDIIIDDPGGGG